MPELSDEITKLAKLKLERDKAYDDERSAKMLEYDEELNNLKSAFPELEDIVDQIDQEVDRLYFEEDLPPKQNPSVKVGNNIPSEDIPQGTSDMTQNNKAFLASPFKEEFRWIRYAIARACRQLSIDLRVADEVTIPGENILNVMLYEIANSDLGYAVITDLNPNVMYELGSLHQASKPTILLSDEATMQKIPFDIRSHLVLQYNSVTKNEVELSTLIVAATSQVLRLFNKNNRQAIASEPIQSVLPQTNAGGKLLAPEYDFVAIKDRAAKAVGRKSCDTTNISAYDEGEFRGWKLKAKCSGGARMTLIIDLNGEVTEIDVD